MGGVSWSILVLKKPFEDFCDFVFVCGLKLLEKLNLNEGSMDLKVMKKRNINKRGPMFFSHKGPYLFFLSHFLSLCLYLVGLIGGENEEHHY